ncbi:hypothetical protein SBF1_470025 [Candidatus Desulfosporosinus infrequens]|uniref:Uncharacterized protein n=1 Tax=Candidatus Desulfosporosinus infrequens TaxID=2043169 RepID=A0A2U3LDT8_9FIRM|nr:hypothetical protein SBF1_470025 [Candidatus Desulfosporosinus infrequens]
MSNCRRSFGVKVRGLFIVDLGLESGFKPDDSGGTTARTKIVNNSPSISSGSAPLTPGNVSMGMNNAVLGVKGLIE